MTGLRGCFAYVHIADPNNRIYESDEDNNEAQVIVRLPFRPGATAAAAAAGPDRGRQLQAEPLRRPILPMNAECSAGRPISACWRSSAC